MRLLLKFFLFLSLSAPAFAAYQTQNHNVTIEVPGHLEFSSSESRLDLAFPDNKKGSETNSLQVRYTVNANNMSQGEGSAALLVQLDSYFPGMELKAAFGDYEKQSGDAELTAAASGYVQVGETATPIAVKAHADGNGKVLNGSFTVNYKAVATEPLQSGRHTKQLTLTLTDI